MDQAEAIANLQSRHLTRNLKPQNIQIFFTAMQIFWTNAICFRSISLDPSKQDASGGHLFSSVVQPATNQSNKQSKRSKKTHKSDSGLPYNADLQCQLYDLQLCVKQGDLRKRPSFYEGLPLPANNSDLQSSLRPGATERDLSQEIQLAQLQKEKLALELEALRLRHAPNTASDDHLTQTACGKSPCPEKSE